MAGPVELHHFREALIFLAIAGVVIPIVHRLKVRPVIGFLVAGLLLGPHALGRAAAELPWLAPFVITSTADIAILAELGVVFLLFLIGLELSFARLWTLRRLVFGLGGSQVAITGAVIATIALAFGNALPAAVTIGACLALSSTAIVLQLLSESGRLGSTVGRTAFAMLLLQDLAVLPILFLVTALDARGGSSMADLAATLAGGLVAVALIAAAGRIVLRPYFRMVARTRSRDLFMASTLFVVVATAVGAAAAGLSMALGAFLAGLALAETEFRREIEIDIEPFKGLLLGLFFISVGMGVDFAAAAPHAAALAASVAGMIAVKAAIVVLLVRLFGYGWSTAIECGLLLAGGGEFAFVVLGLAGPAGIVAPDAVQFMLLVASGTMLLTPLMARIGRRLAHTRRDREAADATPHAPGSDAAVAVIVVGYGRVGRMVGDVLAAEGIGFVAVDRDADIVAAALRDGQPVTFGNAARPELLHRIGLGSAPAVVVTMDDPAATEAVVAAVRGARADTPLLARCRDSQHAGRLFEIGANTVVLETLEAGLDLARALLAALGQSPEHASARIDAEREARLAPLRRGRSGGGS